MALKVLLSLLSVLSVIACAKAATSARIFIQPTTNNDGSVTLDAEVIGGFPAANYFIWTLPDGTRLSPGNSNRDFSASPTSSVSSGTIKLSLRAKNGYTSSRQSFRLRVESVDRWHSVFTYTLGAVNPHHQASANVLITAQTRTHADGTVTLIADVTGVTIHDDFYWTLPHNARLNPGRRSGSFVASSGSARAGGVRFTLLLENGRTSSYQTISFRAENSRGAWYRHTYQLAPAWRH